MYSDDFMIMEILGQGEVEIKRCFDFTYQVINLEWIHNY